MKRERVIFFILSLAALYIPYFAYSQELEIFRQEGIASWYGREFDGRPTASGEIYDSSKLTAAHQTLPFGTVVVVTNRHNNKKITVRINDRGPYAAARIIDVSRAAADQLDMIVTGTAPVLVESADRIAVPQPKNPVTITPAPKTAPDDFTPPVEISSVETPPVYPVTHAPDPAADQPVPRIPVSQPSAVSSQIPVSVRLIPETVIAPNKVYRLQVGSYKVARNAVEAFDRLKNAGLNPNYERHEEGNVELFRVVLAGVRGTDVRSVVEKLGLAGFREALIREER
jgi:rare lipoprotein A